MPTAPLPALGGAIAASEDARPHTARGGTSARGQAAPGGSDSPDMLQFLSPKVEAHRWNVLKSAGVPVALSASHSKVVDSEAARRAAERDARNQALAATKARAQQKEVEASLGEQLRRANEERRRAEDRCQAAEQRAATAKEQAEATRRECEETINTINSEAEKRITQAKQEAEQRVSEMRKQVEMREVRAVQEVNMERARADKATKMMNDRVSQVENDVRAHKHGADRRANFAETTARKMQEQAVSAAHDAKKAAEFKVQRAEEATAVAVQKANEFSESQRREAVRRADAAEARAAQAVAAAEMRALEAEAKQREAEERAKKAVADSQETSRLCREEVATLQAQVAAAREQFQAAEVTARKDADQRGLVSENAAQELMRNYQGLIADRMQHFNEEATVVQQRFAERRAVADQEVQEEMRKTEAARTTAEQKVSEVRNDASAEKIRVRGQCNRFLQEMQEELQRVTEVNFERVNMVQAQLVDYMSTQETVAIKTLSESFPTEMMIQDKNQAEAYKERWSPEALEAAAALDATQAPEAVAAPEAAPALEATAQQ